MLALLNAVTFIPRKSHENPPNKLIVTKFIRGTLPVFNDKVFLDFIDKLSSRIDNKNKKDKKQRSGNPHKYLWLYLVEASQQSRECKMKSYSSTGKIQKL